MSIDIIKSNYLHSRINYIERFMFSWLYFNAWYGGPSKGECEIKRVIRTASDDVILGHYRAEMSKLNDITEPKLASLITEIDKLSRRDSIDKYGNLNTSYIDTTSTKYKIIVLQGNAHTTFLKLLGELLPKTIKREQEIHKLLKKIRLFSFKEADENTYFRKIYRVYSKKMSSEEYIAQKYDAVKHIQGVLYQYNIVQFGELLYKTGDVINNFPQIKDIEDGFALKSMPADFYEKSIKDLLELELELLYKFRCAIFHGDIDMNIAENQDMNNIAKSAYEALDNILYPILAKNSAKE